MGSGQLDLSLGHPLGLPLLWPRQQAGLTPPHPHCHLQAWPALCTPEVSCLLLFHPLKLSLNPITSESVLMAGLGRS